MLQRLWDIICYIITGDDKERDGVKAKWDYGLWTRYRYAGTHRKGCGKHNLHGPAWILTRDFRSSFDWIIDWKDRWTAYWQGVELWTT